MRTNSDAFAGVMTVNAPKRRTNEEARRRGEEIYERDIRPKVEKTHHGKIVAIDMDTGDYAIGDMAVTTAERLLERRPDADIWCVKVGYPALRKTGLRGRRIVEDPVIEGGANGNS